MIRLVLLSLLLACLADARMKGLPAVFERNTGQAAAGVEFLSRGPGYSLLLERGAAVFRSAGERLVMRLAGANPHPRVSARGPAAGRANYLLGNQPDLWRQDVALFGAVAYTSVYPGVDLVFRGGPELEYDFVLAPGAQPDRIRLAFEGARRIELSTDGDLVLTVGGLVWRHHRPRVYQEISGQRREVEGRFVLLGHGEAGFELGPSDPTAPVVIDPVLSYSTYLGGTGNSAATAMAVDAAGDVYIAGWTESRDIDAPQGGGGVDTFIAKLNRAGDSFAYLTYLGGRGDDRPFSLAVDPSGTAVLTGWTYSTDFPVLNALQPNLGGGRDAYVLKLDHTGRSLIFSTYLGGTAADAGNAVAVDAAGEIYVAGETESANFPILRALQNAKRLRQDAFVTRLSAAGTLLYSTFLGGNAEDRALAVAVDSSGCAYVAGGTYSTDFPALNALQAANAGGQDAFLAKLNPAGNALVYSTYLGGSGGGVGMPEMADAVAVDSDGNSYLAGSTASIDFPVVGGLKSRLSGMADAFVAKIAASGKLLLYGTYLGGASVDHATAIAVESNGAVWVAGYTASPDFPVSAGAQACRGGDYDGFLAQLDPSGATMRFGTCFGGRASDAALAMAVPPSGAVWIAGQTLSTDLPTLGPLQSHNRSAMNAFVARFGKEDKAVLTSPVPGSTLAGTAITFTWTRSTTSDLYWLDVGNSRGQGDISAGTVATNSRTITNIPSDGRTIYVRLWTKLSAGWDYYDYVLTAASDSKSMLLTPAPGSTLPGATVTFTWTVGPLGNLNWLDIGTSQGQGNIAAGALSATSCTVAGIPVDGRTIYVRLWSRLGTGWVFIDYTFTAARYVPAMLLTPASGSPLTTSTVAFTWSPSPQTNAYWLDVGTSQGSGDLSAGAVNATSRTVTGIPVDGRPIYVRLWTRFPEGWVFIDYLFADTSAKAVLTSPAPGSKLGGDTVTFTWTASQRANTYWLDVGTRQGTGDIAAGPLATTSQTVKGIPVDGRTIHVRLWTKLPEGWLYNDYVFTAAL